MRLTHLDWTFVTTGLPDALDAARGAGAEAASSDGGKDLDVVLMGGGATIGSALDARLVDDLSLHLAPVVLGAGTPLFTGGAPRTLAAARRDPDIDRDAPDVRRPVTCSLGVDVVSD